MHIEYSYTTTPTTYPTIPLIAYSTLCHINIQIATKNAEGILIIRTYILYNVQAYN
ncbi:hypothetical protein KDH_13180 [Dictyobacter sp. S3.2.2.5]|uniref:Uncharacterized protein n=1 Tax=Dictyobacter halimunensis TaxID=3026934 RepID=A0ABQ6FJS2_9CHLR|nr:hypothetical protein KDH_13180 [Dictyobacter sp. S3.2.2.5]